MSDYGEIGNDVFMRYLGDKLGKPVFPTPGSKPQKEVSLDAIKKLMGGRLPSKDENGEIDPSTLKTLTDSPEDIKELQDFCARYGIIGANFGALSAKDTLAKLKRHLGFEF